MVEAQKKKKVVRPNLKAAGDATKKDTWEQHPANLIPPLTTKHASALSVDGTPSLARCRDIDRDWGG